jgi:hypothetical protein
MIMRCGGTFEDGEVDCRECDALLIIFICPGLLLNDTLEHPLMFMY